MIADDCLVSSLAITLSNNQVPDFWAVTDQNVSSCQCTTCAQSPQEKQLPHPQRLCDAISSAGMIG